MNSLGKKLSLTGVGNMNIDLTGKKAIISGSTTGIGYAIAEQLAKAGALVLINGRTKERVASAIERLNKEVPEAEADGFAADLGHADEVERLTEYWSEADILVNNLGLFGPKDFFEITDDDWERHFQVNVMSAVRLSRHYARGMVNRGWGRVLFNASSVSGFRAGEMVHFGATKAALLGVSRGIAESVAGTGVTVNAFLPGPTRTENVENFMKQSYPGQPFDEIEEEVFSELPDSLLGRFVSPQEIGDFVVFLASEQASAITGAALRVDGGMVRSIL